MGVLAGLPHTTGLGFLFEGTPTGWSGSPRPIRREGSDRASDDAEGVESQIREVARDDQTRTVTWGTELGDANVRVLKTSVGLFSLSLSLAPSPSPGVLPFGSI